MPRPPNKEANVPHVSKRIRRLPAIAALAAAVAAAVVLLAAGQGSPCTLANQVSVRAVPLGGLSVYAARPILAAPLTDDGTVIAWSPSRGPVYLTRVDSAGTRTGSDILIPGTSTHGLTATPRGYAALVRRPPPADGLTEELWLVEVDPGGSTLLNRKLIGGNDPGVVGNEWPDAFSQSGRVVWNGRFLSAYYSLQRRWPDSIAHQGDQLSHIASNAVKLPGGWDWGCSHSLDLRLSHNGTNIGAVCLSDSYPGKGIYLNRRARISNEPSGDRAGQSAARLGGLVPVENGFWVTWTTPEGRASDDVALMHLEGPNFRAYRRIWLTANEVAEDMPHLARFGAGMLAAWRERGSIHRLARLDLSGNLLGASEVIAVQFSASDDFITYASGDVGWAYVWGTVSELKLVRVRRCP